MGSWNDRLRAVGLLWLRVLMGLGIATHGYPKVFEEGRMEGFTAGVEAMGIPFPGVMAWGAALSELVGGLLVAAGLLTRFAAFTIFCTMTVAAFVAHADDPFSQTERALAYWTMAGAIVLTGPGPLSVDGAVCAVQGGKKK